MSPGCSFTNSCFVFKKYSVLVSYQLRIPVPSLPRSVQYMCLYSCPLVGIFLETSCLVLYQFVSWGFVVNGLEIRGLYNIPFLPFYPGPFPFLPLSPPFPLLSLPSPLSPLSPLPSPLSPPQIPQGAGEAQAP